MALRLALSVGGTALASSAVYTHSVYADGGKSKSLQVKDLPIYEEPCPQKYELVVEDLTLEEYVSPARKSIWKLWDGLIDTRQLAQDKYSIGREHTLQFVNYLQEDAGVIPRATFIVVSGLGGIVAGYRGGIFRKALYSSVALTAATALCYPNQAVNITSRAWDSTKVQITKGYVAVFPRTEDRSTIMEQFEKFLYKTTSRIKEDTEPALQAAEETSKQIVDTVTKAMNITEGTAEGDPGQSSKDDKDMYTTRDSS